MGVLDGIKVLEMARVPPAEMPGMFLADMGADVLKIETPPDEPRGRGHQAARRLRLRQPQQALARAQHEGARGPGHLQEAGRHRRRARGGLPPRRDEAARRRLRDALRARTRASSTARSPASATTAPTRTTPPTTATTSRWPGVLNLIGEPGRKPIFPLNLVADYGGASMHGALGIMMALFARERTGRGQHVDVSYLDTVAGPARRHAQHALLLERRHGPEARRGLPGRLVSLLRGLRHQGRQAPHHRLHRALAVGELLQGDQPAGHGEVRPQGRPVRARGQRGRGGRAARRSRPSSGPAPGTSGTTSWSRPTSAWARSTSRRRSSPIRRCRPAT